MSLAKSFRSETQPNSLTWRGSRLGARGSGLGTRVVRSVESPAPSPDSLLFIEPEAPADQRDRQAAVAEQRVVEGAQREFRPARRLEVLAQLEDLASPHGVAQRLRRLGAIAAHFRFRGGPIHLPLGDELVHRPA